MVNRKIRWIPPILWGILLAVLSLIPGGAGHFQLFGIPNLDKIGHFGMYAIWTLLVFYAWKSNSGFTASKVMWLTFLIGTVIGVGLEFLQNTMTLGRTLEIADMIANGLGSLSGALSGLLIHLFLRRSGAGPGDR